MKIRKINRCFYCQIEHNHVEAEGMWYCPNPFCSGPGGASFRSSLKSYKEVEGNRHTIDEIEWAAQAISKLEDDLELKLLVQSQAEKRCNPYEFFIGLNK